MSPRDLTNLGGLDGGFHTTRWTQILCARRDDRQAREAMNELCGRYWRPVYCYLRHKGFDNERAKDFTQGFFDEVVLGRKLIQRADRTKGKFRTFLLTALNNHVASAQRAAGAQKRRPRGSLLHLDGLDDSPGLPEPASGESPEQAFHYAWASALLDEVLHEVETACRSGGQQAYWEVFAAMVLGPILEAAQAPAMKDLCRKHRIASESKASNMIVTVKRRFQATLKRHVRQFVSNDEEVDGEIQDLMAVLSHGSARSWSARRIDG